MKNLITVLYIATYLLFCSTSFSQEVEPSADVNQIIDSLISKVGGKEVWKKAYEPSDKWHVTMVDYILLDDLPTVKFKSY
ncbi:hypothetical protein [Winogradskyella sp. 3972H.M.0a.05]|uniref:hypothetical protein n=1 Tax=Winogradskyella sp. 3972H.M.0a.05 TaxID=2950277 RepID=UPI00339573C4